MSEGNKRSPVWNYFTCIEGNSTKARCILCNEHISRGGTGKKATTTALNNHIKNKHPTINLAFKDDANVNIKSEKVVESLNHKQQTLLTCLEKKKLWDINNPKSVEIHYAIGEMIALDNQPNSIVDDKGFNRLIKLLKPQYQLPSRKYIKDVIISDIFVKCKQKIEILLNETEAVSITSDIWTESTNNHSFLSFTCHWIENNFESRQAVLNIKHFPTNHTSENISELLLNVLDTWNLKEKIHLFVRDNGINIVNGIMKAGFSAISCFIHTLQLVVKDSIKSQRAVSDVIAISRNIVTHFNHSSVACSNLSKIQTEKLNESAKKLIQDVSTRWNSTYYMLERLLEQKSALALYAAENGKIQNLSSTQWTILENVLHLLQPFEEITKIMSSSEGIASEVIPTVLTLQRYLDKTGSQFFGVGTMKDALKDNLTARFSEIFTNEFFVIATLLDPRFKVAFFPEFEKDNVKKLLLKKINAQNPKPNNVVVSESIPNKKCKVSVAHSSFWECFSEIAENSNENAKNVAREHEDNVEELNSYFNLPLVERKSNALKWWQLNKNNFPVLANLARKFLSTPASSVWSERLFSEAGNICSKTRNRLLPDNIEELAFIHHNLPLLNYCYR